MNDFNSKPVKTMFRNCLGEPHAIVNMSLTYFLMIFLLSFSYRSKTIQCENIFFLLFVLKLKQKG